MKTNSYLFSIIISLLIMFTSGAIGNEEFYYEKYKPYIDLINNGPAGSMHGHNLLKQHVIDLHNKMDSYEDKLKNKLKIPLPSPYCNPPVALMFVEKYFNGKIENFNYITNDKGLEGYDVDIMNEVLGGVNLSEGLNKADLLHNTSYMISENMGSVCHNDSWITALNLENKQKYEIVSKHSDLYKNNLATFSRRDGSVKGNPEVWLFTFEGLNDGKMINPMLYATYVDYGGVFDTPLNTNPTPTIISASKRTYAITKENFAIAGDTIQFYGANYSTKPSDNLVIFSDGVTAVPSEVQPTWFNITVPYGAKTGPVYIETKGVLSDPYNSIFIKPRPIVTSIFPKIASPGSTITINGVGFSSKLSDNQVVFYAPQHNSHVATPSEVTPKSMTVIVPITWGIMNWSPAMAGVKVTTNGVQSEAISDLLSIKHIPVLRTFGPTKSQPGDNICISGQYYSKKLTDNQVIFTGGVTATPHRATSRLLCVIVPTGAEVGPIKVRVFGLVSAASQAILVTSSSAVVTKPKNIQKQCPEINKGYQSSVISWGLRDFQYRHCHKSEFGYSLQHRAENLQSALEEKEYWKLKLKKDNCKFVFPSGYTGPLTEQNTLKQVCRERM
ncbi:MAG: IPT/TIG domain-containing protein [Bermanella sp.]